MKVLKKLPFHVLSGMDRLCAKLPKVGKFRPLRGNFSALERLDQQGLPGEVLLRYQAPGPCPSGSMTERAGMQQNNHQPWPVFWVRSDAARLVGNMHLYRDEHDQWCSEGVFHQHQVRRHLREDRMFAQIIVPRPTILAGAWTSIASNWGTGNNYYHWMLDCLTRLKVRDALPESTRILLPRATRGFIDETLEMLGLTGQAERPSACSVQPERYYFCAPTAMTGVWNPVGYDWLREKFAPFCCPAASGKAIFLTRRGGVTWRLPPNLPEIEEVFARHGFTIVDCGVIPVKEQMRLASMAPAIAGLHGAAMTNLLWAHPGIPVLEIFMPSFLNACYEQIAFQGGLKYSYQIIDTEANSIESLAAWARNV
jgi:capsular polysaccharide biosynthesis protein